MKRQDRQFCPRSMKQNLPPFFHSCCSHGDPSFRRRNVLLLGLLLCIFAPKFSDAVFVAPIGCTSVTWKLGLDKVQNITCSGQNLVAVPKDGKEGADVIKLDLSNNLITTLAMNEFQYFTRLVDLDLSYNKIPSITVDTFLNMTNLQYLKLAANDISSLPSGLFADTHLITLNVSANPLVTFEKRLVSSYIEILDLSHLSLSAITKDHFIYLTKLKEIDLSYNNISTLEKNLFKENSLQKIDLSWNKIELLDFLRVFPKNDIMHTLILSNNKITQVDKDFLNDAVSLTNLDLSNNQITSLSYDVFYDCPQLETLYLDYNGLDTLPSYIFSKTPLLKYLYLSNNLLSTLPNSLLEKNVILEYLDLSGNRFTTISKDLWAEQTSIILDVSNNPFDCACTVRDYLFGLKYDTTRGLLNEETTTCTDTSAATYVFLDYNAASCSGNLGSNCTFTSQCMARNAECSSAGLCVCSDIFYDNNGVTTYGGLCKPKIAIDYPCTMNGACIDMNAECVIRSTSSTKKCYCKDGYYDDNPLYLDGTCRLKVELGVACVSINNMCKAAYSTCGSSGKCECQSAYYDNDGTSNIGGECLPKLPLYSSCNETYQCATANAACINKNCTCSAGFYDFGNSGKCQVANVRNKRDATVLQRLCKSLTIAQADCSPSSFFSCYPTNTSDTEIGFTSADVVSSDEECREHCFEDGNRYYHVEGSVCLCGILSATQTCCKYVTSPCNTRSFLGPTSSLAIAGINISHVPQLYAGFSHRFSVTTTLRAIDQIKWSFGDSQTLTTASASADTRDHTYTYSGHFWLTVSACVKAYSACENAVIPIRVQVPPENLTTYITGIAKADVSSNLTSIYTTFPMGYDFEYYWSKNFNGDVTKKQGCKSGWTAHRYSCIKLVTSTANFNSAKAACTTQGGNLLQIDFEDELSEIVTALTANGQTFYLGAQRTGGVWRWSSDGSKTVFSDSDLTSSTLGDCVVLVGSTHKMTSASCTTAMSYACRAAPVSCPKGGQLMSNGYCYILASTYSLPVNTWQGANTVCKSTFGGWLANITDDATQTAITSMLTAASVSEAWFGLSDQQWEGYYLWADDTSFNFNNPVYKPTVTSNTEDCFVTTSGKTWNSQPCSSVKNYVCQYSENIQRVTVPNYLVGIPDIGITAGTNLRQLVATDSFPATIPNATDILLFPGLPFTRSGSLKSWIFHAVSVVSGSYDISLQVFRPVCSTGSTLIQAGCATTQFATCTTPRSCASSATCNDKQYFCYLSETCTYFNESCTCNSESGFATAVNSCGKFGTAPGYEVIGQTSVTVVDTGENFYTIPAGEISIQEHDIIGIQFPTGKNVVKCESLPSGLDQQKAYRATSLPTWLIKWQKFPTTYTKEDLTCYIQAIYTQDAKQYLPKNLGYSSTVGDYDLAINIVETDSRQLSLRLEESVADINWVYPTLAISNTTVDSLGTVYTEWNKAYDFTVRVERGTNLESIWSFDSSQTILFSNSCVSTVASSVGNQCNSSLYWSEKPFASFNYNTSTVGNITLDLKFYNSLGQTRKTLIIKTEKIISGVAFSLTTPSLIANNVAINRVSQFTTSITSGTGVTYSFTVGGASTGAATSNSSLFYLFSSIGTFTVQATVTNILGSRSQSLVVYAKKAAEFASCQFLNKPYIAAVGISFTLQVQCNVNSGSEVSATWVLSDRTGNITSAVSTASASTFTWTQAVTFLTVQSGVSVTAVVQDPFEKVSTTATVDVYNAVPSVTVTSNSSAVYANTVVEFTASVPASPGNYGTLSYIYSFGDNGTATSSSGSVTHSYLSIGNYTVTVTASNGPSNRTVTSYVTVYQAVTGLALTYNGPKEKTNPVLFTASVSGGNFLSYRFISSGSAFDVTLTTSSYTHTFSTAGDYNVTVIVSNALSQQSKSVTAYIMDATDLRITALTVDGSTLSGCIETGASKQYAVTIIHYNAASVVYDWNFGDGTITSNDVSTKSKAFTSAANFTISVTAKYLAASAQKTVTQNVCVQERISGPSIVIASPVALPSTRLVSKNVTVTVITGNPLKYSWSTNATATGSLSSATFPVQFSAEGTYFISVALSNEINSKTVTKTVLVVEDITSMVITCAACIENLGEFFVLNNTAYDFEVITGTGTSITFAWNFGDTTTGSGTNNIHTYNVVGDYNLTVTGSNPVAASVVQFVIIHVEVPITQVTLVNYFVDWKTDIRTPTMKNLDIMKAGKFQATAKPTGMDLEYVWIYENGLTEEVTTTNIGAHNYTKTGLKSCIVTARNAFSNYSSSPFQFYVIEKISAMNVTITGGNLVSPTENYNVTLNKAYNFTMSSSQIVSGTETYFFTIRNSKNVLQKSTTTKIDPSIEFNFPSAEEYLISATIENSLGTHMESFRVEAMAPVSGPFITAPVGEDGNITLGSSINLTGGVASGKSPQYNWLYSVAPVGESVPSPSNTQSVVLTPGKAGLYIVTLQVQNWVSGPLSVNYTINVMEGVAGVGISVTMTYADAVEVGDSLTFTGTVTAGTYLSYSWNALTAGSSVSTGNSQDFTFQFPTQAVYNITLKIENFASSGVDFKEIFSLNQVPKFTVQASGATYLSSISKHVAKTNYGINFTSSISNKDFLTFDWMVDSSSAASTDTYQRSFAAPAEYTVSLDANNKISSESSAVTIIIQDPIQGFSVMNCFGAFLVNSAVTLTATYSKGTDIAVQWELANNPSATGVATAVTYTAVETYSVNVTGSNYVSEDIKQCFLEIQGQVDNLKLAMSKYQYVGFPITFTVSGDFINPANITWVFSHGVTKTTTNTADLDLTFAASGTFTLEVTVANKVSSSKVSLTLVVEDLACKVPVLTVDGSTNRNALRARDIEISVNVFTDGCTAYTSMNKWTIYKASSCVDSLTDEITLDKTVQINTPILKLPKKTLTYGLYCLMFNHRYNNTPVDQSKYFNLTIVASSLQALMSGGDDLGASEGSTLKLDASLSSDPDEVPGTVLAYDWSCSPVKPTILSNAVCASIKSITSDGEYLTGLTLTAGDIYKVTVTVSATNRTSATANQTITIKPSSTPVVLISCVSCQAIGHYFITSSKSIAIEGTCISGCTSATTYQWTVEDTLTATAVTVDSTQTTTTTNQKNFVLKHSVLQPNRKYTFKLTATESAGTGISLLSLPPASQPGSGHCTISPSSGIVPLHSLVTVTCQNWIDPDPMSAIYYKIVISSSTTTYKKPYISYYGTKAENKIYVVPFKGTSYGSVDVKVTAINDYGAETDGLLRTVSFTQPTLLASQSNKVDFIVDQMISDMKTIVNQNNPSLLLQYCMAVLSYLNDQSENNVGTPAERMVVRDIVAKALNGLPRTSIQNIQQMATAVEYLAEYPDEISTDTLTIVSAEIESMAQQLETMVVKGDDQRDFEPNTLLSAVTLMQEALQTKTVTSDAATLTKFGDVSDYTLDVINTVSSQTYSSEQERVQSMIIKSMEFSTQLMVVPLKAQLADENEIEIMMADGSIAYGKHVSRDKLTESYTKRGVKIIIPDDILSYTTYSKDSVFQLVSVSTTNRYNFGTSTAMPLNTKTVSSSFHDTAGSSISVANLPDKEEVRMYLFDDSISYYEVNDSGIMYSTGYQPLLKMNFTTGSLIEEKNYETALTMPQESGVAIHIMIQVNFTNTVANLQVTLYKNGVAYTNSDPNVYARPKTIDKLMMERNDHTEYTFFIPDYEITDYDAFKLRMKVNQAADVAVGTYFSKCEFFNVGTASWDSSGCSPQPDSIPTVISCKCNHMTSYGGSLFVSPDEISFTDLTQIDIASNPVAIITCSVVLGLYIILLIAFRRMDILDVKRISLIPLCGKDGSFKYEVTIVTGRLPGAGTTAHVGIRLIGEYGKSARQHVSKVGAFCRNCSDTFLIAYDVNLGDLRKIQVWHDNSGTSPSWYLSHVIVNDLQTDMKYYFFGNTWLSLEDENSSIQKELKVAGSHEMTKFSHRMKTAMFNSLADKHLWLSLFNRPAQSRFTRVQRVTCCVTIMYAFVVVNAMWYGLLKKNNTELGFGDFGWEEVVLALVSNVMVLPLSIGLVLLFKKSRSKPNLFDNHQKPQTAQTLEIENLCGNSQAGSFQSTNTGAIPYDLERESTIDSVPHQALGLHRSRHVAKTHRENTDDSLIQKRPTVAVTNASSKSPLWNEDGIMKWPETVPTFEDGADSRPSTGSTMTAGPSIRQPPGRAGGSMPGPARKTIKKGDVGHQLLEELDKLENDLKESESRSIKSSGSKKSSTSLRKPTMHKSQWGSLEDILQSDDESIAESSGRMKKRGSTTSQSTTQTTRFNPRADPRINGNGKSWPKSRESVMSGTSGGSAAHRGVAAGIRPGYYSEMTMESRDTHIPVHKEKCLLPPWCIYIAYVLCGLMSVFSVIIVILYCFKFGYNESIEWVLALILSLILSFFVIEPLKALLIAIYVVAMFKNVEEDEDEDFIDIQPTFDNSNEKIKDVKFKPISGFALLQAKEEGRKIHRMNIIIRQFIAYIFYLWLIMVIVYVNFRYDSYLMTKHVEHDIITPTTADHLSFTNVSSIEEFWDWTRNVFVDSLYKENLTSDEEHGFLLGAARMRQIRGLAAKCIASNAAGSLGTASLTERICHGEGNYDEDTKSYAEGWNDSNSNYSWMHHTAGELGSTHKVGHMATYGGGGYPQVLGTSLAETDTILTYLKEQGWIDLRTRAIIFEFTLYSPGSDITSLVALLAEFSLTGGVITSYEIQSQKLSWFQKRTVEPLMVLECILFLVVVYSVIHLTLQIREHGKQFFKDIWNWFEMLTTLMAIVSIGMYIGCVVEATNAFNHYLANQTGFTNFERAVYMHVGTRYLNAWLLFLLMYKVVKQMRFIKFMYVYEKTLSKAVGHLVGTGFIYIILLVVYAQVGCLMYGRIVSGFESVGHSVVTLVVMIRGSFDFWPMLDHQPVFSHFYVYSYYAFAYGIMVALVISILTSTYKTIKSQMYYKRTLDMQDYEMIEFMLKRFKLWTGLQKPKPAFRRVRFPGLPSVSSRCSSSYSNRSSESVQSAQSVNGPQFSEVQLRSMMARMAPTWQAVLKRMDKILALDDEEETLVKRAENEMKDLNWKCRINELERQHKELLSWKNQPSTSGKPPAGDAKQRQSILKRHSLKDNGDRKAPATSTGAPSRTAASTPAEDEKGAQGRRPLSDQGARVEPASTSKRRSSSTEKSKIQTFFKSLKPSKAAWNK